MATSYNPIQQLYQPPGQATYPPQMACDYPPLLGQGASAPYHPPTLQCYPPQVYPPQSQANLPLAYSILEQGTPPAYDKPDQTNYN